MSSYSATPTYQYCQRERVPMPPAQVSTEDRGLRNAPTALHIPDVVLHILAHVDTPTLLSLRLVSTSLNSIISTHQYTICKSIIWHDCAIDLDLCPTAMRDASKYYYLRTSLRARKAQSLASNAIAKREFWFDCQEGNCIGGPGFDVLVARCTRGILVIWTLNDIKEQVCPSDRLPTYVPTSAPSSVPDITLRPQRRPGRLCRLLAGKSKIFSALAASETSDLCTLTTYIEAETCLAKVRSAQYQYVRLLDRTTRIDLELAQVDLMVLMPLEMWRCSESPTNNYVVLRRRFFALQQGPTFMLSVVSTDAKERDWAWDVVTTASAKRITSPLVQEIDYLYAMPFDFEEQGESRVWRIEIMEEASRVKSAAIKETWRVLQAPPITRTTTTRRTTRRLPWLSTFT